MIVGLVGLIGSGKGTVAETLVKEYDFRQDSFAASLKDACSVMFGWPRYLLEGDTKESREWREVVDPWWSEKLGMKNLTPRYALQHMGTDVLRTHFNQDIWFLTVENRIRQNPDKNVVISDVRFPNEIKFIQEQGGHIVRISRGIDPEWFEVAEKANNGNIDSLELMKSRYNHVHQSEWAWAGCNPSFIINNNATLEDLKKEVSLFAKLLNENK
jgi:hypothetical protein